MFENQNIVVLGAGKSGIAVSTLLQKLGANVTLHDDNDQLSIHIPGVTASFSSTKQSFITQEVDLVVKSPGIPYTNIYIQEASACAIPIVTEIEIAYLVAQAPIISITGSNGKTTTTTLISSILTHANRSIVTGGNIGDALCEQVFGQEGLDWIVSELSSFQLMGIQSFKPSIAVLLNITPAHLDYHGTLEAYIDAKMAIFKNQHAGDIAILNDDQALLAPYKKEIPSTLYLFSQTHEVAQGAYVENGTIWFKANGQKEKIMDTRSLSLKGNHNVENVLASIIIAKLATVATTDLVHILQTFQGVAHRLEYVTTKQGVAYYNDSKATNPEAAIRALCSFEEPIVHICGGLDRGIDFHELIPIYQQQRIKHVIAYGQSKEKIQQMATSIGIHALVVNDIKEAVAHAERLATAGDVVLLSPACASWDMHTSFEVRGDEFKEAIKKIKG